MILFPFRYALQWQRVISILRALRVHIDNDQRQNHFFQVDLVNRPKSLDEMRRRINVRSPLADMREQFREKTGPHCVGALVIPVNRLVRFLWEPRSMRDPRCEGVRQIDKLFSSE